MSRRRALDWVLIVALTGSWAVLAANAVSDGLRTGRGRILVGVTSAAANDVYPTVRWSDWSELQRGDRIENVDGEDLVGASALRFYDLATRDARERGFTIVRADRAGAPVDVRVELTPFAWWWMPLVSASANLAIAVLLLVRAPLWHLSRRNLVAFWCAAAAVAVADLGLSATTSFEENLKWILMAFYWGLGLWNVQEFTLSARPVPKLHRALAVTASVPIAIFYLVKYHLPHTPAEFRLALIAANGFPIAVAAAGFARAYLRSDLLEQRQLRWVILGLYVALAGTFLGNVASLDSYARTFARVVPAISGLGFPIGILVSVLGYRWLDIDRLISATASYTIVGLGVLGAALAVVPRLAHSAAPIVGVDPAIAQWLLTMALVGAAIPGHRFLWPRIDRRMFAARGQRTLGFERLLDEVGQFGSDDLARLTGERVDALLQPESIVVYGREGARFAPLFARGQTSAATFEGDSLLVRALERRGRPLSADAAELDAFDRAALETLGVSLIVPTRGREGVAAFACLGPKRSGDIYTPEEIAQLTAVANRCSEVLLRLAEAPTPFGGEEPAHVFRRDGEDWAIASAGKEIRVRDMRGLHYLAVLLREPGREFHVTDLVRIASGGATSSGGGDPTLNLARGLGDAGEILDAAARAAYRKRLEALEEEREGAERAGDLGRLDRTSEEREALLAELSAAARGVRASSHGERARVAVTKAIKSALEKIAERHPELGAHLVTTVRRGYTCAYEPDPRVPIEWDV